MFKSTVIKFIPSFGLRWLYKNGLYKNYKPAVGKVNRGDFDRVKPFSRDFGYDRGGPIDRYYIENFLQQEAPHIKGRILEIGDNEYTIKYGGNKVTNSDILHVNEKNTQATFIGDLTCVPQIPDNTFDCIILTQTLHLIFDYKAALQSCHRILKPGGVLLLTSPGITPIDQGEWKETWYWSFTDKSFKILLADIFAGGTIDVQHFGNVFAASAFLYGTGLPEVSKEKLDFNDPQFQVIITVKAIKGNPS